MEEEYEFQCAKCGACCRWLFFPIANTLVGPSVKRKMEFYQARGVKLQWSDRHEILYACVPHTCRHLNTDNKCNIYRDRPEACRDGIGLRYTWLKCQGKFVKKDQKDE